ERGPGPRSLDRRGADQNRLVRRRIHRVVTTNGRLELAAHVGRHIVSKAPDGALAGPTEEKARRRRCGWLVGRHELTGRVECVERLDVALHELALTRAT